MPAGFSSQLYLNSVVIVETSLAPSAFSDATHAIEASLGRIRGDTPNLPRTLDIDIIAIGQLTLDSPALTMPHPRARCRRYVLQPLADLRPDYLLPGETKTVSALIRALPSGPRVTRYPDEAPF